MGSVRGAVAVVIVTVLVVTATIPVGGVAANQGQGNGTQQTETPVEGNETTAPKSNSATPTPLDTSTNTAGPMVSADATPIRKKLVAIEIVRNLSANGRNGLENHISRAESRFNGTLGEYTDPIRVSDSAAFTDDAVGVRALAHLHRTNQSDTARKAADLVYEADNGSAHVAVADARRVLDRYGDSMDNQGLRRSAESHLEVAEQALDRAERARQRGGDGRKYFGNRAQAITQLRTAHRHAGTVQEFVDRSVEPTVTIDDRADPVRNGSEQTRYVVSGTVSDPRPSSIEGVTVSVDGTQRTTARTTLNRTAPGQNATYQASVNLTERVAELEVRVESGQSGGSGNSGGNGPGSGEGRAVATLALDGDGLTDTYERTTLETDPLDPDSDSDLTARNEADDGIIDREEDYDEDNLTTQRERELGTDPLVADTDDDGLADGAELVWTWTDPLASDSDGDGTPDGAEDPDEDGLTHAEEVDAGTPPNAADIDGDGLPDPGELDAGTDPLGFDTDDDHLRDGRELETPFNTDPLDPDTDSDGVLDGNETYTTTAENETLGASVSLTGPGDVAADTSIEPPTHARFTDGRAPESVATSEFVTIDVDTAFESATVTFDYDESAIKTNESSLGVYRVNESTGAYERLPSEVDGASDTVEATTDRFSTLVVLDAAAAMDAVRQRNQPFSGGSGGIEDAVRFDFETTTSTTIPSNSTAMINGKEWRCWNQPRRGRYRQTPTSGTCEISDGKAIVREETNRARFLEHTTTFPEAGPDEALFVNASLTGRIANSWSDAALRMVVESQDGEKMDVFRVSQNWDGETKIVEANPRVNVTKYANETVTIRFSADGRHTYEDQDTMSWIEAEHVTLERRGGASKDSDNDDISDAQEAAGVPLAGTLRVADLDPNDSDTDGDGRDDGVEIDIDTFVADQNHSDSNKIVFPGYAWSTDPVVDDTDGDGLVDDTETDTWDIPTIYKNGDDFRWAWDSANGSIDDVTSDPQDPDTDNDGLNDFTEKELTHTDPNAEITYNITRRNQAYIDELAEHEIGTKYANAVGITRFGPALENKELTDKTDDFDFVWDDTASEGIFDRLTFIMVDEEPGEVDPNVKDLRSDRWFSNVQEAEPGALDEIPDLLTDGPLADPWDPDTDDDGLTDGQEGYGLTQVEVAASTPGLPSLRIVPDQDYDFAPTNLTNPDTDGDGSWDGWIGVYDVGYSDNVILYEERLNSDSGLTSEEIVPEQKGTHQYSTEAPFAVGADIDDDNIVEHSNIHIGELHWIDDPSQTGDPTDPNVTPSPELTVEVDYHESVANTGILDSLDSAEKTYQLYGMDVTYVEDDELFELELPESLPPEVENASLRTVKPTLATANEDQNHDISGTAYSFLTYNGGGSGNWIDEFDWTGDPTGTASCQGDDIKCKFPAGGKLDFGMVVFHSDIDNVSNGGQYDTLAMKTLVHETGHLLGAGRADDGSVIGVLPVEIYSGDNLKDDTHEEVGYSGPESAQWSIMSRGWNDPVTNQPMNGNYTAFSIEELTTIEFNEIETTD